jgi:EF hand domain-containing protein
MKHVFSIFAISLMFTATGAFAAGQAKPATTPAAAADQGKMDMSHGQMNHGQKTPDTTDGAFTKLDANKDGKLSKAEMAKDSMAAHFSMLDANKDGSLTPAEYASMHGM